MRNVNLEHVRFVHEEAIKPDSLYTKRPLEWFVGRTVKSSFQSKESGVEHLWVQIMAVEDHDLIGVIDNDPVCITHLKCGDEVKLNRTQIEAVDLTRAEWIAEMDEHRQNDDYCNPVLGVPTMEKGLGELFEMGLTPRQALKRWRAWKGEVKSDGTIFI